MKWLLFLLLFTVNCFCYDFAEFDPFQGRLSKEYVTHKISYYLQYSKEIENYFEIQEDALVIFSSPKNKKDGVSEYRLDFGDKNLPNPQFNLVKPISSVRIAIDPGHFGGKWARLEERYIDVEHEGLSVNFDEGTLSFLTAVHLKKMLEGQGASVFLTRTKVGEGVYPENFFDWLKKRPEYWEKGVALSTIFRRHYNRLDLRERARLINEYQPDLTIAIHYNTVGCKETIEPTDRNFNLIFIPGAFCNNELASFEDRFHFLRLICTQDLEGSMQLAHVLVDMFSKHLKVFPFTSPVHNSLLEANGVFSRNLCITRLIKSPICYGETLIQNNEKELINLSKNDEVVDGIPCPQRVIDVANAYYEAILAFFDHDFDFKGGKN